MSSVEGENNPYRAFNQWVNSIIFPQEYLQWFSENFEAKWFVHQHNTPFFWLGFSSCRVLGRITQQHIVVICLRGA
jgi:hypothetical protein